MDDLNRPLCFYVTGELFVYNPKRFDGSIDSNAEQSDGF